MFSPNGQSRWQRVWSIAAAVMELERRAQPGVKMKSLRVQSYTIGSNLQFRVSRGDPGDIGPADSGSVSNSEDLAKETRH